ncbi:magnesium transporter CorA family protein [Tabrizicola aquatica]|uniref:magnesium transporter CorA family protein n=1 Tax=Tabrizicola aquatica TaxID=909926 RepID=UPI000CD2B0F4|nr:magnesium transporter CorA family protein [Tabrizicola aquatica]
MISAFLAHHNRLERLDLSERRLSEALWIDLEAPTEAEEDAVEAALGIDIPTREDMQEIEVSSRIYREGGVLFLTAQVIASPEAREAEIGPVTFAVLPDRLVTVHYHHPRSLSYFADWAARHDTPMADGLDTVLGLLEAIVDRLADILEAEMRQHETLAKAIFAAHRPSGKAETLGAVLQRIGRAEAMNGRITESLATIQRILSYLTTTPDTAGGPCLHVQQMPIALAQLQDVRSLREVAAAQAEKVRFLLDATLGVINIRQSDVIKIFSVVAFVFLPPTLIASIYGMNFVHIPELQWSWGYPMALGMMVLSALVPWLIFRWKKWL